MSEINYTNADGQRVTIEGISLYKDKAGRFWLWCDQTETNLAYKERSEIDCYLSAIDSLLFHIKLKDERIAEYKAIVDKAMAFADSVKPDNDES